MSHAERRNWLVAYDIADPRRLVRVHRFLKRRAIPVQYSVFVLHADTITLKSVLDGIANLIAPAEDGVRAYHLPKRCEVAMLGAQSLPDGVTFSGDGLDRLLHELTFDADSLIVTEIEDP